MPSLRLAPPHARGDCRWTHHHSPPGMSRSPHRVPAGRARAGAAAVRVRLLRADSALAKRRVTREPPQLPVARPTSRLPRRSIPVPVTQVRPRRAPSFRDDSSYGMATLLDGLPNAWVDCISVRSASPRPTHGPLRGHHVSKWCTPGHISGYTCPQLPAWIIFHEKAPCRLALAVISSEVLVGTIAVRRSSCAPTTVCLRLASMRTRCGSSRWRRPWCSRGSVQSGAAIYPADCAPFTE